MHVAMLRAQIVATRQCASDRRGVERRPFTIDLRARMYADDKLTGLWCADM